MSAATEAAAAEAVAARKAYEVALHQYSNTINEALVALNLSVEKVRLTAPDDLNLFLGNGEQTRAEIARHHLRLQKLREVQAEIVSIDDRLLANENSSSSF